jgi:hypothetical protein
MIRPPRDWLKRRSKFGERVASREMETQKKKPLGRALPRTEDLLDRLSEITERDLDEASAEATDDMRQLVESEDDEGDG